MHTCPVVQATSADLDIWQDPLCFPVAQSSAADWQFRQQLLFVHESPLAARVFRQIVHASIQTLPTGNNCRFDFWAARQFSLPRRCWRSCSAGHLFDGGLCWGLPNRRQKLMMVIIHMPKQDCKISGLTAAGAFLACIRRINFHHIDAVQAGIGGRRG